MPKSSTFPLPGVGHEDVVGLQIAVNDVVRMRDRERAHDGHHQLDDLRRRSLRPSCTSCVSGAPCRNSSTMNGFPPCSPTS